MGCTHKRHLLAVLLSRSRLLGPPAVKLVATIAMESYRARFNRAFQIESLGLYQKLSR
jgi:hypothetical protein